MRIVVAGAEITDAVVDTLDSLQNDPDIARQYTNTLDELTRAVILDLDGDDAEADSATLSRLRVLQMIHRDIGILSAPPDADRPENDKPAFEA